MTHDIDRDLYSQRALQMKNMMPSIMIFFLLTGWSSSCQSDQFCIDNVSYSGVAQSGEHTITLPTGEVYTGAGALPFDATIGSYSGKLRSVVTSQVPSDTGLNVELVHYFDDGQGNTFWTSDKATMTPTDDPSGAVMDVDDTMTVIDGTGDFKCASGVLKNVGTIDFIKLTLDVTITGNVCGGCDK